MGLTSPCIGRLASPSAPEGPQRLAGETMVEPSQEQDIASAFRKALNGHGYGFQYAVLKRVEALLSQGSPWIPIVPEFPVEVNGHSTRIDFLLTSSSRRRYLVCECKRANPALANWCFARAGWIPHNDLDGFSYAESLSRSPMGVTRTTVVRHLHSERIYQVAREVRTGEKGDSEGKARDEIEAAATQVCRGLNGIIDSFAQRDALFGRKQEVSFFPVIFTTANLFTTQTPLTSADLATGAMQPPLEVAETDWVWYDYPQSPSLKHSVATEDSKDDLREVLYHEFVRRIAVVGVNGIDSFLRSSMWEI